MAKLIPIQTNFTAGQLDELLDGRVDLVKYKNGLKTCKNFIPFQQGGIKGRPGSRFVSEAKFPNKKCRLIKFSFGLNQDYVLEFGEEYIRFHTRNGTILTPVGSNLITNGTFNVDIASWSESSTSGGSVAWDAGKLKLNAPVEGAAGRTLQLFSTVVGVTYRLTFDVFSNSVHATIQSGITLISQLNVGPAPENTLDFTAQSVNTFVEFLRTDEASFAHIDNIICQEVTTDPLEIASPYLASELFQIKLAQSADVLYLTHPNHPIKQLNRFSATSWALIDFEADPPPTFQADTDFNTTLTLAAGTGDGIVADAGAGIFLASDVGRVIAGKGKSGLATIVTRTDADTVTVDIISEFTDLSLVAGEWVMQGTPEATLTPNKKGPVNANVTLTLSAAGWRAEDVGKYVRVHGGVARIHTFTSTTVVKGTVLVKFSATTAAAIGDWTLEVSSWSDVNGFPRTVGFHNGRLLFAGSNTFPDTVWGSRVGLYKDFARGTNDSDPFVHTLGDGTVTFIEWLATQRDLILGTSGSEVSLSAGVDEPITPSKVRSKPGTNWGSESIQPVKADRKTIFVQSGAQNLREVGYDFDSDGYLAGDLMLLAKNIGNPGLVQIDFERIPVPLVWGVRSDGTLISLTYDPSQEVFAWAEHKTNGEYESVCSIVAPDGKKGQTWVAVKRPFEGFTDTGADLITNGTFNTDISGWTDDSDNPGVVGEIGWEATEAKLELYVFPNQTGKGAGYQAISTTVGKRYSLRFDADHKIGPVGMTVKVGTSVGADDVASKPVSDRVDILLNFTALTTTTYIYLQVEGAGERYYWIDNVSVFENIAVQENRYIEFFDQAERIIDRHPLLVDSGLSYNGTNEDANLTPGATSGSGVTFTANVATFTVGDVGKQIFQINGGKGRATITSFTDTTHVVATITNVFPSIVAIEAGDWGLAVDKVTGLDHLEGTEVQIVGDMAVYPPQTVLNGEVTLDGAHALKVDAGLQFIPEAETLRPAVDVGGGNIVFMTKGYNKLYILFNNTVGAEINGLQENWRSTEDLMDESVPAKTEIITKTEFGYDTDARIRIRQTQPLPITVIAIQGMLDVGDE